MPARGVKGTAPSFLEIQMDAEAGDEHGPAVLVEAWIVHEGQQGGEIEAAGNVGRVVSFAHALASIFEGAVAQHKTNSSQA